MHWRGVWWQYVYILGSRRGGVHVVRAAINCHNTCFLHRHALVEVCAMLNWWQELNMFASYPSSQFLYLWGGLRYLGHPVATHEPHTLSTMCPRGLGENNNNNNTPSGWR